MKYVTLRNHNRKTNYVMYLKYRDIYLGLFGIGQ